jgi:hypothetical protein
MFAAVWLAWTLQADACEAMNREENMLQLKPLVVEKEQRTYASGDLINSIDELGKYIVCS